MVSGPLIRFEGYRKQKSHKIGQYPIAWHGMALDPLL